MSIKAFRKPLQVTGDSQILATAVDDYVRQITLNPFLDGKLIQQIKVSTVKVDIPHSLGRRFVGWAQTRKTSVNVYEAATQTDPTKYLTLQASAGDIVDIYIF